MVSIPPSTTTELDHSLRLRDYQYEMFERSEKGNVIVAVAPVSCFYVWAQVTDPRLDGHWEWQDSRVRTKRRRYFPWVYSRVLIGRYCEFAHSLNDLRAK